MIDSFSQLNPFRRSYALLLKCCILLIISLSTLTLYADIVTLKDGATLRCQVIRETQSPATGERYIEIRIAQSIIWINRDAVDRIDSTPPPQSTSLEMQQLIKRLTAEGILVPSVQKQLDFDQKIVPEPEKEQKIPITITDLRGWAYIYQNEKAMNDGQRILVAIGDTLPLGYILSLSPNTRMTMNLKDVGDIGLEAGAEIRFDEMTKNSSMLKYTIALRLEKGRCWFDIKSTENVILRTNSVRCIIQEAVFFTNTTDKPGAIDITYLRGKDSLRFSRNRLSEEPSMVDVGQILKVDPASNKLPVEAASNISDLEETIKTWKDWQPEKLDIAIEQVIPPLMTFPSFRALPALHPYKLNIDQSLMLPPETRSLGEILNVYKKALQQYRIDTGAYPTFDQGLDALFQSNDKAGWKGPYVSLALPRRDSWGEPFLYDIYTEKGRTYVDIRSKGPNRKDDKGLGDDFR